MPTILVAMLAIIMEAMAAIKTVPVKQVPVKLQVPDKAVPVKPMVLALRRTIYHLVRKTCTC
jgi:hypothetical protein